MSAVTLGIVIGSALGGACALLVHAVVAPRPALAVTIRRWERGRAIASAPAVPVGTSGARFGAIAERHGARLLAVTEGCGMPLAALRADLALLDMNAERFFTKKVLLAMAGSIGPSLLSGLALAAGSTVSITTPVTAGAMFALIGFVLPDQQVRSRASERRAALRLALSSYLDLVAMSLSGGRGVPEALPAAVGIGGGWAFELLGDAISRARYLGVPPWRALSELGDRTGVPELVELGKALTLVADDGSKVRTSLVARAASARQRQLAEAESAAEQADGSMNLALFVLFAGIFLFILYPAVAVVMAL
ncbi:type II secretion system F family protein [Nocardioides zeae]|uniref:Type II secretion system F family protein n=1 Tax=Nocardioides imazamoxiresistens TaxID=3231893 RepID=A0ABU3Q1H8_9ACTN|nr:type II secretion system F family protein [Nocardioides zeae]MDT9594882.1 type II secretion system F family protein [Nocardioides zeae]